MVANSIGASPVNHSSIKEDFWPSYGKKNRGISQNEQITAETGELPDSTTAAETSTETTANKISSSKRKPLFDPNKNHGRYAANDYTGCPLVKIPLEHLKAGDACPHCVAAGLHSKLCKVEPNVIVKLQGNPLVTGTRYEIENIRCSLCGGYYTAELPKEIAKQPKYDETCYSTIAIARYYSGLPFHRIEQLQALQKIPLADATQWDMISRLYKIVVPAYLILEQLASNSQLTYYDDSSNRILEAYALDKAVHTTAFISMHGEHPIHLFFTSLHHAGENFELLLEKRATDEPLTTMTDASSQNMPKYMDENLMVRWVICFCLVHGRRKFYELRGLFVPECEFVLDIISKVYHHEVHCKKYKLSPDARLLYHQEKSTPLMEALRVWLNNQLLHHQVEENSSLGLAIRYMQRHWHALTRFLHIAGAPIDNSIAEQTIKIAIRHRRNSLFYKTFKGAIVGDCMMSLIHTAAKNKVNIYEYLNALQIYASDVKASPEQWLPWNFKATQATRLEDIRVQAA